MLELAKHFIEINQHLSWWFLIFICTCTMIIVLKIYHILKTKTKIAEEICECIQRNKILEGLNLVKNYPNCINKFTSFGYTPFLIACAHANTLLVVAMLKQGADLTLKSKTGESAFYLAAFFHIKYPQYEDASCLRTLYYAGANIDEPNAKGFTALQMATLFSHAGLVKWLLFKKASTNVTPDLHAIAQSKGHKSTTNIINLITIYSGKSVFVNHKVKKLKC